LGLVPGAKQFGKVVVEKVVFVFDGSVVFPVFSLVVLFRSLRFSYSWFWIPQAELVMAPLQKASFSWGVRNPDDVDEEPASTHVAPFLLTSSSSSSFASRGEGAAL